MTPSTSVASWSVFEWYKKIVTGRVVRRLARRQGLRLRWRMYTVTLTFWLMIQQRLEAPGTLTQAVNTVRERQWSGLGAGRARRRRRRSKRRRGRPLPSAKTGAYCRARQRVPTPMFEDLTKHLTSELQKQLLEGESSRPVFLLDGSSLQLPSEPALRELYPPARNQHGSSHWPVMRFMVLHEARTALALPPVWGPMRISEQALAERLLAQAPVEAVVLGDRNMGIFATAYAATRQQRDVVLRLTSKRARRVGGGSLVPGTDRPVVWRPSRWDRRRHPELPDDACISGRLLVCTTPGGREPVYLFTTLQEPASEVLNLYGLRWNVETDLRSLKQTVRLHRLTSKSEAMLEKELWAAIAAYNLVRAVMVLAARETNAPARRLSFTQVLYLVNAFLPNLLSCSGRKAKRELKRLIALAATCKLPQRRRRRSYPRAIWRPGYRYPARREVTVAQSK